MRQLRATNFIRAVVLQRELWQRLCEREVIGRYRGSVLGWGWSLLNPLLMLSVYTFVFSVVFQSRWGNAANGDNALFAINLFAGLIAFNFFGECVIRATGVVVNNANYVKRVIFPLEILAPVAVGAALFHALTSLVILGIVEVISGHGIPLTMVLIPLVWLPLLLGCLAISWALGALGVYLRDLGQLAGVGVNVLMFMSAVFYPLQSLPERWQPWLAMNPLVHVIEETRQVCVNNKLPNSTYVVIGTLGGLIGCELAFRLFQRMRRGFADVL
jgi:lipopolysaccharide transport system permease protein